MTKVYLLNSPFVPNFNRQLRGEGMSTRGGTLYYPIWLSYAAGVLEEFHEVKLVDAVAKNWNMKEVLNDVKKFSPELIVIDSNFASLNNDLKVSNILKSEIDSTIILVGPPASQFAEGILEYEGVDIVARFEYDFTIKDIAEAIEEDKDFKNIKGISYKENGKVLHNPNREFTSSEELDEIPFVSKVYKKHLNIRDYFLSSSLYPVVQIFTGRGCIFKCTFCSWPETLMGRKYRVRSPKNVLDELEWVQNNLPEVKEVFFEDDTFTINRKRVLEFCREYRRRGLDVTWACNARVGLDYETMKEMKLANCRLLIVGYESGSDDILKNIKKGITIEQIKQFAKDARKASLLVHGDFIVGLPGETKDTIELTRKLIKETKPEILQVQVASPLPGTQFYDWCKEMGYLLTDDPNEYLDGQGHQKAIISYPELTNEEMVKEVDKILKGYYLSLKYVPLALRQVLRRHSLDEIRRLWYSTRMFIGYIGGRRG